MPNQSPRLAAGLDPFGQPALPDLPQLGNCELEQATHQAERMRTKMQSSTMMIDGIEVRVSASFGVTVSDGSERNPDTFVRVADEALYRAKANGRNCVIALSLQQSAHAS